MSSSGVLDPNALTVDRLRKELSDHNVPVPKYPRKDNLVELYKQHIVNSRAPKSGAGRHGGLEFSDEDDAVGEVSKSRKSLGTMSKRRSVGTKGRDELIITSSGINISNMTDLELVESLQRKGADVGPVTDTTRSVYEKKLLKLLESGGQRDRAPPAPRISPLKNRAEEQQRKPVPHYSDEDEAEDVDEEEEEDLNLQSSADNFRESYGQQTYRYNNEDYNESLTAQRQYTKSEESSDPFHYRRSMESAIRQPLSSFGQSGDAFLSRPQLSGFSSTTRRSQVYTSSEYSTPRPSHVLRDGLSSSADHQKTKKSRRNRFCLIFCLLVIVVGVIAFFAIYYMDPAFENPLLSLTKGDDV